MIYQTTIKTAASVGETDDNKTTLSLNRGLLYQIDVYFPPGPSGLLHAQIFEKGVLLYPSSENESFIGDNHYISFNDTYLLTLPPYEFTVKTWNEDTKYAHTVIIRIGLLTKDDLIVRYLPQDIKTVFDQYIKENKEEQSEQDQANLDWLQEFLK